MSRAENLYHLQQIDSQIDARVKRLKEIESALADDQVIRKAQNAAQAAEQQLQATQKQLRYERDQVQSQRSKIKQSEDRLYSGTVGNPKELEDIQNEVAALKRYLETLEEKQLEVMLELDEAQEQHDEAQDQLNQALAAGEVKNADFLQERSKLEADVEVLQDKRENQTSKILDDDLSTYDKLRSKRAGVAVTKVQERNCSGCGSTLPSSIYQLARSPSKITNCESCGRILFAE